MKIFPLIAVVTLVPGALSQGSLAHVAVGGGWQTTITMLNLANTAATARVTLYSDSGAPLVVAANGQATASQYLMDLAPNGAASLVLVGSSTLATGWARVDSVSGALLRGQAIFHSHSSTSDSQAVVPLSLDNPLPNSACVVPFPSTATSSILLPFDDTAGSVTGFALANPNNASQSVAVEFDDENNLVLINDTINLPAFAHLAFALTDRYPTLAGKKGVLRVKSSAQTYSTPAYISTLAFLFNSSGGFATLLPVYQ